MGGDYGPYIQSQRKDLYKPYAQQLVKEGKAYYCFCTKERLDGLREQAAAEGKVFKYDKHCMHLSKEEVEKLVQDTKDLRAYQEEPTPPEILEKIPVLKVSDISEDIAPIYNEERKAGEVPCICHPIDTNGIGYLTLIFDLRTLSEEEIPYAGLLQAVLGIIDTEQYEYGKLFNEINRYTGGIEHPPLRCTPMSPR